MKNNKGFISTSIIFAFFITFLLLLVIIITSYAQNRILMNQVKKDIKNNLVIKYNFNELEDMEDEIVIPEDVYLSNIIKIGDYVQMTPTSNSYNTITSATGYNIVQNLNPSELNLWRVIKINPDGTIEMVSEYVSSTTVNFAGLIGIKNSVGVLNEIASKYVNSKYTVGSRHMGYNGQTEYIINTTKLTQTTPPWTSSTGTETVESQGGGDNLYSNDINLVSNAVGTLIAKTVNTNTTAPYRVASRYYYYGGTYNWAFGTRYISNTGGLTPDGGIYQWVASKFEEYNTRTYAVRPIVILKSGLINIDGKGTAAEPYILP